MKSVIFFAIVFMIFFSVGANAQEKLVAATSDQAVNFILVGKVAKKMPYSEAWIKVVHSGTTASKNNLITYRQNKIEIRTNRGKSTLGYDKYAYTMNLYQVDCKNNKFKVIEEDDYDSDGKILSKEQTPDADWNNMVTGTVFGKIGAEVCGN